MNPPRSRRPFFLWLAAFLAVPCLAWSMARWARHHATPDSLTEAAPAASAITRPPAGKRSKGSNRRRRTGFLSLLAQHQPMAELPLETIRSRLRSGRLSSAEMEPLFDQWCRLDPKGAWDWWVAEGQKLSPGVDASHPLMGLYFSADPAGAMAAIRKLAGPSAADGPKVSLIGAVRSIVTLLLGPDDAAAGKIGPYLDELAALAPAGLAFESIGIPSGKAPKVAERIASLPKGPARDRLLESLGSWSFDPEAPAPAEWTKSLSAADRIKVEAGFLRWMASSGNGVSRPWVDWAARRLTEPDAGSLRGLYGARVAGLLAEEDPTAAWDWAGQHLSGRALAIAAGGMVSAVWDEDPAQALEKVASLGAGGVRTGAAEALLRHWAENASPAEAAAWAQRQEPGTIGAGAWVSLGYDWAQRSPEAMMSAVRENPALLPSFALQVGLPVLMGKDTNGTLAWAREVQPAMTFDLYGTALEHLAKDSPARAAGLLQDANAPAVTPDRAEGVITQFFRQDPAAARTWMQTLPTGALKEQAAKLASPR